MFAGLAGAHSATGVCSECHTMHNSEDGTSVNPVGPQPHLLRSTCIGCHVRTQNAADGRAITGIAAPQVGPQVGLAGFMDSGGYFRDGGGAEDGMTHNVADIFGAGTGADSILTVAPGGVMLTDNLSGEPVLVCIDCHDQTIGHSPADSVRTGTASSSYRMLKAFGAAQYVSGTGDLDYEAGAGINTYNASSMNTFCASCHGGFHENPVPGDGDTWSVALSAWIRHPTDVDASTYAQNYQGTDKIVPLGGAGVANQVMCISCHRPHGNNRVDMIRFTYDSAAGDGSVSLGCETCHGSVM